MRHQPAHVLAGEPPDIGGGPAVPARVAGGERLAHVVKLGLVAAAGDHHHERAVRQRLAHVVEHVDGRPVGPLEVLEHQQRGVPGERDEPAGDRVEDPALVEGLAGPGQH